MMFWLYIIIGGLIALVVVAALVEAYLKRNSRRRLSDMRPDPESLRRRPWQADGVAKIHPLDQRLEKNNWRFGRRTD
ncbi:hypothetical protein FGK63_06735 [Ruegeria sediminis]|uniref:Uncharacterized protein n=1 Tax=Ruegeria sediminis TaxID=2583820 RepID=A0ABY2X0P4_9RHOB|nr:hypothetical protein [Ruegeria sediminis]TMV08811.1 hypothetical protein FGK63_06735 [Ruegeria sediminis]